MSRPSRFINTYGVHRRPAGNEAWYYTWTWGEWTGPTPLAVDQNPVITATRLRPVRHDRVNPTQWGAVAERWYQPPYDYQTYTWPTYYRWVGKGGNLMGSPTLPFTVVSTPESVVVNLPYQIRQSSINKALSKIPQGDLDLGVFLGELGSTVNTLADLVSRIANSLRYAWRGQFGRASRTLANGGKGTTKGAANDWLQYQYGVAPLIKDAYALQELIKDGLRKKGEFIKAEGFSARDYDPYDVWSRGSHDPYTGWKELELVGSARAWARTVVFMEISNESLYHLSSLGLANPLVIAWELTTLSFVTDWFLPIGNFLAGLTAPLGTTFARGFVDKVFEADIMSAYVRGGIENLFEGAPEHASWKYFGFEREVLSVVPDARLVFGTGLSSINRALSAVALLRQRS